MSINAKRRQTQKLLVKDTGSRDLRSNRITAKNRLTYRPFAYKVGAE